MVCMACGGLVPKPQKREKAVWHQLYVHAPTFLRHLLLNTYIVLVEHMDIPWKKDMDEISGKWQIGGQGST